MFWTAVTWGLGVSLGGAVGLIAFFAMFMALEKWGGRAATKAKLTDLNEKSLDALLERNDLSRTQIAWIERLVDVTRGTEKAR